MGSLGGGSKGGAHGRCVWIVRLSAGGVGAGGRGGGMRRMDAVGGGDPYYLQTTIGQERSVE